MEPGALLPGVATHLKPTTTILNAVRSNYPGAYNSSNGSRDRATEHHKLATARSWTIFGPVSRKYHLSGVTLDLCKNGRYPRSVLHGKTSALTSSQSGRIWSSTAVASRKPPARCIVSPSRIQFCICTILASPMDLVPMSLTSGQCLAAAGNTVWLPPMMPICRLAD